MEDRRFDSDAWITTVYDAAIGGADWSVALKGLRSAVGADGVQFAFDIPQLQVLPFSSDMPSHYYTEWFSRDPWIAAAKRQPLNTVVIADDVLPEEALLRTDFYNEILKPTNVRHLVGSILGVEDGLGVIGVLRAPDTAPYNGDDRRTMAKLLPHLRRSLQIMRRLELAEARGQLSQAALDRLEFGVIVVDRAGRPVLANKLAQTILAARDGLVAGQFSPLRAAVSSEGERLSRLVAAAAANGPRHPGGGVRITRPSGRQPLDVLIAPLVGLPAVLTGVAHPAALLILQDRERRPIPRARVLLDLYGLTAAETELAERMATGARLEDIAEQRGVRLTTLRSQLSSILHKTGTARQSSLIQLLASLSVAR